METRNLHKMLISAYDKLISTRYRTGKKFIIIRVTYKLAPTSLLQHVILLQSLPNQESAATH